MVVALSVAAGFLALQIARQVHASYAITQRAAEIRAEIERVRAGNEELGRQLAYLRSDSYVTQEARRILNLGSPDERVLIIPPGAEAELPPELRPAPSAAPLLEQWIDLFFGETS